MQIDPHVLFSEAYGRFAIGAYSINTLEQVLAVFQGNLAAEAPFIIAVSPRARRYAPAAVLEAIIHTASVVHPEAIFAAHLDHGDEHTCYEAIESGHFASVMIDASHAPFDDNAAITRRVVERAHEYGIRVEAELGTLGGKEDDVQMAEKNAMLTDPAAAAEFIERTGCDSLAVAIGTSHGAYKFKGEARLHLDRLSAIQERLPGFPLVLHGASSVPAAEVRRINLAGGSLDSDARGLDEHLIPQVAALGITKINIDTDSRLIWTRVHREYFRDHPDGTDLRVPGACFMAEFAALIAQRSIMLGSAGQAHAFRS